MIQDIFKVLLLNTFLVYSDEGIQAKFSSETPVIMLNEDNFDTSTKLGREMIEIPWFIYFYVPRCAACPRMVPIWEDISREHDDIVNIAAINGEESPSLIDRFGISTYPTLIFYAPNNKMYNFEGIKTVDNITDYIVNERWQKNIEEGQDIPSEVNQFKIFVRRITHPIMIPIVIIICFIVLVTYIILEDRKYEKSRMAEAKQVKIELVRRAQLKREKQQLIQHEEEEKQTLLKGKIE